MVTTAVVSEYRSHATAVDMSAIAGRQAFGPTEWRTTATVRGWLTVVKPGSKRFVTPFGSTAEWCEVTAENLPRALPGVLTPRS
jgi:hypothetical protein